jgi:hypothetical protein
MITIEKEGVGILARTYTDDVDMTITTGENSTVVIVTNGSVTVEQEDTVLPEVGIVFTADVNSWSLPSNTVITEVEGGINIFSTDNTVLHKVMLDGYGGTMLSDMRISWKQRAITGTPLVYQFGIDAPRVLVINSGSIQSNGSFADYVVSGSVTSSNAITYDMEVIIKNAYIEHNIRNGAERKTVSLVIPMGVNEHNEGKFYIGFSNANTNITDFKIEYTAKVGTNVLIGDSVSWGRGADSFDTTWWSSLMNGRPNSIMAHGNSGFDMWLDAIHEIEKLQPSRVWIMGSYVDVSPGTLSTFQTKYTQIVDFLKTIPSVTQINHLASFPSNGLGDIRPYNDWKAATFNTGIDRYIDDYYPMLESANGTGTALINSFDWGGSHLKQVAQDIVANSLLKYL